MKLIIDIDKKKYEEIKQIAKTQFELTDKTEAQIIANGTPVSTEGDLISRSELKKALQGYKHTHYDDDRPDLEYEYVDIDDLNCAIDTAPTFATDEVLKKKAETYATAYRIMSAAFEGEVRKNKRSQGKWISVSEKLPPNYIICLFCDTDGNIFYGHRKSNNLWYEEYQTDSISDVIAWQELPKPYKKGGAKWQE